MSEKACHTGRWVKTSLRMRCRFRTYRMFRVPFITCELGDTSCMIVSIDDFLMYKVKLSSFSMNYVICSVLQLYTWICFSFLIFMLIDNHLLIFGCNFQLQLFFGKPPKSPDRNGAAAMQLFALAVWILWTTPATKEGYVFLRPHGTPVRNLSRWKLVRLLTRNTACKSWKMYVYFSCHDVVVQTKKQRNVL